MNHEYLTADEIKEDIELLNNNSTILGSILYEAPGKKRLYQRIINHASDEIQILMIASKIRRAYYDDGTKKAISLIKDKIKELGHSNFQLHENPNGTYSFFIH